MTNVLAKSETIDLPAGYAWRPPVVEDVPAIHALLLAADEADQVGKVETAADLQREFDDPWSPPQTDALIGLAEDGSVAGYARIFANTEPENESKAWLWVEADPRQRGELMDILLEWAVARGRQRLAEIAAAHPGERPRWLQVGALSTLRERVALLERHGFRPRRYYYRMRRSLAEPIPDAPLPAGLTLRPFEPALNAALREVSNEAFRDHWGHEDITETDWEQFVVQRTSFRPDLTRVVFDGDEIAGFCLNRVEREQNERLGLLEGWIGSLGVRRPWRKRGIASALLCESMRAFKAAGLEAAGLGVDTENTTGALGLYQRLGFVAHQTFVNYGREG